MNSTLGSVVPLAMFAHYQHYRRYHHRHHCQTRKNLHYPELLRLSAIAHPGQSTTLSLVTIFKTSGQQNLLKTGPPV